MPKSFSTEFRAEVIQVALSRPEEVTLTQIADSFGISPGTLGRWLSQYRIDNGSKPGVTSSEQAEIAKLKREKQELEYEVEILRRAAAFLSQAHIPSKGSTR